jgi:hypothetical protein
MAFEETLIYLTTGYRDGPVKGASYVGSRKGAGRLGMSLHVMVASGGKMGLK